MAKQIVGEISFFPKANIDASKYFFKIGQVSRLFAFMTITKTGLEKSIMDATGAVRLFLEETGLHDYSQQKQGPESKVLIKSHLVMDDFLLDSVASLYRPLTKNGDPRIWFSGLNKYAHEGDLLLLFALDKEIYVANISNNNLWNSFVNNGFLFNLVAKSKEERIKVRDELLDLLKKIHAKGWIQATTNGDTAVGDTLEHELGIKRNNKTAPDYKGIELKASRITAKQKTRITLFGKVPDQGMTYRQILNNYGKIQVPKNSTESRLQLYETLEATRVNAYNLCLNVNDNFERLEILYSKDKEINSPKKTYVSSWQFKNLSNTLKEKHKETFFVKAESKTINGKEHFLYNQIVYTQNPNISILFALFANGTITLDLLVHESNGKYRDHGSLFKIHPKSIPLLFGKQEIIDLN